jgi:predicted Rossmann fold nucleotide-binding protein DprA/Smf involved in DNA uptake
MNFPVRNRIISGLSQGTVVIDADVGSGAMITAKKAILQGRDVYAVPGNIDAQNTSGTNSLIRDGAQAVLCGADIIKNYSYMYRDSLNIQKMVNSEARSDFSSEVVRNMGVGMRTRDQRASNQSDVITLGYIAERKTPAIKKPDAKKVDGEDKVNIPIPVTEKKTETRSGDDSARVLESLNDKQRKVFEEMPLDRAVTVDYLTKTGFALGEVMSALTILEIKGLVSSLPGALYIRK